MNTPDFQQTLGQCVDWSRPELATAAKLWQSGDAHGALLGLVHHLRQRAEPHLGYTRAYVTRLRGSATNEQRAAAGQRFEAAFGRDLLLPYHNNAFAALGAETILLAATPDRCRRLAARVVESRANWANGYWGVTQSLGDLLRFLWPLDECADADLIPVFGWLLTKSAVEWHSARAWTEIMLGTSGHNWWAHTFFGFWMLGTFFPEFKGSDRFAAQGHDYLQRELTILFEADGWSKEGSPGYHQFATDNLMAFAHLAALNGIALPDPVQRRLRTIADASWRLIAPDEDFPVFGDHVRAAAYLGFPNQTQLELHPSIVLRRHAARFGLPEAKFVAESLNPHWQSPYGTVLPDEGVDLSTTYQSLVAQSPAACDTCLPNSGYYVMRQNWTAHSDYVALNAGTVGPRITSHKHADIFNFELYCRGRRILVDNWYGTVADERKDERVRMWRVSSPAHNVATVDGADHIPILREWLFGATVVPTVDDWRSTDSFAYFSGAHEGYIRPPTDVTAVRRKLFYRRGQYWILIDRFTPSTPAEHVYQLHFHLNVPATLQTDGRVITRGSGGNLLIVPVPEASGTGTLEANPYPIVGYENPQHLCYTRRTIGSDLFVTLLVPFENANVPTVSVAQLDVESDERTLTPWEATALAITIDGRRDVYFDQHMQWNLPWKAGGFAGSERLFHSACAHT